MKTLVYTQRLSLDGLSMVERPTPTLGTHEVLVRVRAVSLNYRDLAIARGHYAAYELPLVPGSDAAGEVVALGSHVTRFAVGDRVCLSYVPDWIDGPMRESVVKRRLGGPTDGVLSEYVSAHESAVVCAASHLSPQENAALPIAGVTAWQAMVEDGRLRPGDVVGITGTGGVSVLAAQLARAMGARVVVVGRDASKLARVRELGAETLSSAEHTAWEERLLELTSGGVDLFLDVVGGSTLERVVAATRVGGTVAAVGFVESARASLDLMTLIRRGITLRAASAGSRASLEALVRALEVSGTRPCIDRVFEFELDEVKKAFFHLEHGRPFGKVVIAMQAGRP